LNRARLVGIHNQRFIVMSGVLLQILTFIIYYFVITIHLRAKQAGRWQILTRTNSHTHFYGVKIFSVSMPALNFGPNNLRIGLRNLGQLGKKSLVFLVGTLWRVPWNIFLCNPNRAKLTFYHRRGMPLNLILTIFGDFFQIWTIFDCLATSFSPQNRHF
jgi:hypothetical protein